MDKNCTEHNSHCILSDFWGMYGKTKVREVEDTLDRKAGLYGGDETWKWIWRKREGVGWMIRKQGRKEVRMSDDV
jgi:hypothetical protein